MTSYVGVLLISERMKKDGGTEAQTPTISNTTNQPHITE